MVDVSEKDVSKRVAVATGRLRTTPQVVTALRENSLAKGDALATARIAGIMAAKRTPDLVPLCHPIAISGVKVELEVTDDGVDIAAQVKTADRTGVEMEALTAVSVAGLTLVDMVKALDPAAQITDIQVVEKLGGKTGAWHRDEESAGHDDESSETASASGSRTDRSSKVTGEWQRAAPVRSNGRLGKPNVAGDALNDETVPNVDPSPPKTPSPPKAPKHSDPPEPDLSDTVIISRPKPNGEGPR